MEEMSSFDKILVFTQPCKNKAIMSPCRYICKTYTQAPTAGPLQQIEIDYQAINDCCVFYIKCESHNEVISPGAHWARGEGFTSGSARFTFPCDCWFNFNYKKVEGSYDLKRDILPSGVCLSGDCRVHKEELANLFEEAKAFSTHVDIPEIAVCAHDTKEECDMALKEFLIDLNKESA